MQQERQGRKQRSMYCWQGVFVRRHEHVLARRRGTVCRVGPGGKERHCHCWHNAEREERIEHAAWLRHHQAEWQPDTHDESCSDAWECACCDSSRLRWPDFRREQSVLGMQTLKFRTLKLRMDSNRIGSKTLRNLFHE